MKHRFQLLIIVCLLSGIYSSCSKKSADLLSTSSGSNGSNTCDTVAMKYSSNIVPILQANCYGCHGSSSNAGSGGIILEGYTNIQKWEANGYLIGEITHAAGYTGMPYGLPKLPDCSINQILDWVNSGAPNN